VKSKPQDLRRFVRALRREIVGYHNRSTVIKALRKTFKLDEAASGKGKRKDRGRVIADVSAADAEAKQVRIEWVDGRIGRVVVGEKGEVLKCVVVGEEGRDFGVERRILGEGGRDRMEGIGARLLEGIY
jgi:central kinetochore subunit Mal2/MCM21